jgi:apolipoprotein N-acyltransferase
VYALALLVTPVLHGLSFPPFGFAALAWIAFVPWFAALRSPDPSPRSRSRRSPTFAGSTVVASWLPRAVANYYGQPFALGVAFFVAVWAVTVAPFVLAFTVAYRRSPRRASWTLPLLAGAAWAATELCRVELLVGNPFGLLGYSQAAVLPLVQVADVTGIYGVSFVLAAVNAALAEVWIAGRRALRRSRRRRGRSPRRARLRRRASRAGAGGERAAGARRGRAGEPRPRRAVAPRALRQEPRTPTPRSRARRSASPAPRSSSGRRAR